MYFNLMTIPHGHKWNVHHQSHQVVCFIDVNILVFLSSEWIVTGLAFTRITAPAQLALNYCCRRYPQESDLVLCDSTRISCHWQTHTTHCITANVLQTSKVDAQCDKLVTELTWQRFTSEVANLQLPHLHLTTPLGLTRLSFAEIFGIRKPESLSYCGALFAWPYV